ncbi:Bifunctional cytochrome P450/NADPH--P450 reductase ascE [Emericellopsis cladophorae]|uniref:Bifunctional cytochrome P450/NADPH--P450 reductase n=1 Tax=Emericellopsis cladophorae TaxID=2686198 RepID=A0A9P9Y1B4_9HYPO|nr:Bifunctional cytochrome P450/NADPH--P450 reductase ascE [Emericellopsis cladophorae]KAI6781323.1 Bifunctional cytochrome P450/NADPH--P450 reductase ascE [Emericellopsis cladophorae]
MTESIPGPKGLPIIGNILDIDPVDAVQCLGRIAKEYGEIYKLSVGGTAKLFVSSRSLVNELSDESRFTKQVSGPLAQLRNVCSDSLFTAHSDEHNWHIAHKILMPAFGPLAIRDMFDEMHDIASQQVIKWARFGPKEAIDVSSDFTRLTLDAIALCSMSTRFNSFYRDEMNPFVGSMLEVLAESGKRAVRPPFVNDYIMRGSLKNYNHQIAVMKEIANEILEERRANPGSQKKDLLTAMINGRDPKTGEGLSDESILNNMIVFLIAGHETTSALLSFYFYYLLTRPDVFEKAQAEVDDVIGRGPVTLEHMSKLPYIEAGLRETLRLHPTAPVITFHTRPDLDIEKTTIGGGRFEVTRGQGIVALLVEMQRDPAVWGDDADEFKPERMTEEKFNALPANSWKPFGNGIRGCIGRSFAWQESLLILAMLLQNFNFRLRDPDYQLAIKQTLTIKPGNMFMYATLRDHVTALDLEKTLHGSVQSNGLGEKTRSSSLATTHRELRPLSILYGSDSGTCETMAHSLARAANAKGYEASVQTLDSAVEKLPTDQPVVIVSPSYNGQPPSNATDFVRWIEGAAADFLQGVKYAVYGCGNKDYVSTFHRVPKLIDAELSRGGAKRIAETGLGDVTVGDIFSDFESWQDEKLWPALGVHQPGMACEVGFDVHVDRSSRTEDLQVKADEALVLENQVLTAEGEPQKRMLTLKLPDGVEYNAGDHLAVLPLNDWSTVRRALSWAQLPWDALLTIPLGAKTSLPTGKQISAKDLFGGYVELSQPATRKNIQKIAAAIACPPAKQKLLDLEAEFDTSISPKRLSVLDVLEQFPEADISLSTFIGMLPPMRPRQYSIASSPHAEPSNAVLMWTVLNGEAYSGTGRRFLGVASTYLANLGAGDRVHVIVKPALRLFHPPPDPESMPVIMACAGTGLAPFRGFVEERAFEAKQGRKLAQALLFIGCRHPERDALLYEEFQRWEHEGIVKLFYAFSRDADAADGCKHVQDRIWNERALIKRGMFEGNARMYVCGGAGVGRSVEDVMKRIYMEVNGSNSARASEDWFQGLKANRYVTEIFS